jgi:ribosome-associated translation inhibitor RaiA
METPPEIQFQGMQGTPQIEEMIAAHIAELDQRFDRITACRVVVIGPSAHHREGGLYEVHIRLALPEGQEVNVERTPPEDERRSDLTFAIGDAFKQARQQLHEKIRRMRGDVKRHDG